ncbi:hypothetical protein PENDEC_c043G04494 [Penicillium decumbens]|uniref:Methionyl/Leucyl tRNA synthetase domain-containing protein n=1 Tax=Penicillium decumbens TaxID=69771 RepID=A0A1V6NS17_PENDC|nr:hypothetical protein PENDEC_c043G04494 [Penicillium decumbens]
MPTPMAINAIFAANFLILSNLKTLDVKVDGARPVTRDPKHIFLQLDKLQADFEPFFQQSATNGHEDKVIYAWFDACIGHISITANYTDQWQQWWRNPDDVHLYQFLGKDNVAYHTVIFSGSQIGTRDTWTKLHHLSTTEYLTYEDGKFSKSRGKGVFGDSAQKTGVASDVWRYYLIFYRPETSDIEFNWDSFISANNNLLLKNLGNTVSRVVKFLTKNFNNIVPDHTRHHEPSFDLWKKSIDTPH